MKEHKFKNVIKKVGNKIKMFWNRVREIEG